MKDFLEKLNWVAVLSIAVAVLTQIGNGSMSLAHQLPAAWLPGVQEATGNIGSVLALIVSAGAYGRVPSSSIPNVPTTIAKILIFAFAISLFLFNGPAVAAPKQSAVKTLMGQALPCDPANLLPGCKQATTTDAAGNPIMALLSKPMQDLANFIAAGFDDAVTLSTAVPELQDGNGQACWSMMSNYSAVLKQHPIPLTLHAAADLEAIRLLNMAANKICQNSACTQVFTDAGNLVNAAMPTGMPLPNLTALCSKVPEIAVVAPAVVTSPSPSPTPATANTGATGPIPPPTPTPSPSPSASPQ